ncbi:tRNA (adenosine(37)-N6)-dimethylallyltransferase MiaA [Hyunsoonleella sp. SJ7]|uniref:tRNA dimethylallyltransferase n=1 Tax=Hyunsoonleella aquatilis TaxID=2762758 RepID=A0A923HKH0_9FLAO|nr:tRNA (adenosine(37)-N6)-dimethylallyltransferase MiaA [Hyunsoonleella aquatilis]
MKTSKKHLISIIGPTAIGKTPLSIKLAQHFGTEIISADSRQFFKEMQIGTAAPTPEELQQAKHHFVHHKSIMEDYNVGAFERDAIDRINQLFRKYDLVIMVGGSGLYVDAVTNGLDDFPNVDASIRDTLNKEFQEKGLPYLQDRLKDLDRKSYDTIAIDNPHRVIRALEVSIGAGKPYSSFLNKAKNDRPFETISIGLMAERQVIYDRINQRVDLMIKDGLLEEVKQLLSYKDLNALNTVGYKELFNYLDGEWTLDFAISEIKKNTRRFAKRQLTWFKKNENTCWFDYTTDLPQIIQGIEAQIK